MRPPRRPVNHANLTRVKIASLRALVTTISVSTAQSFGFGAGLCDYALPGQAATRQPCIPGLAWCPIQPAASAQRQSMEDVDRTIKIGIS
jgi:hypothetical protein